MMPIVAACNDGGKQTLVVRLGQVEVAINPAPLGNVEKPPDKGLPPFFEQLLKGEAHLEGNPGRLIIQKNQQWYLLHLLRDGGVATTTLNREQFLAMFDRIASIRLEGEPHPPPLEAKNPAWNLE